MDTPAQKALEYLVRETYAYLSTEIAIFGTGDLGRAVASRVLDAGGRVMFTDSNASVCGSMIDGIPVLPPADVVGRAGAVVIASVAHAALLSAHVRRLCEPDQPVVLAWIDADELLVMDQPRRDARRTACDQLERCLALVAADETAVVVLSALAAVTDDIRAQWPSVLFMPASQIAAYDLDRANVSAWIIGDTSPDGSRIAVALANRGRAVRSPFSAAAHRAIDSWHRSMTARNRAAA